MRSLEKQYSWVLSVGKGITFLPRVTTVIFGVFLQLEWVSATRCRLPPQSSSLGRVISASSFAKHRVYLGADDVLKLDGEVVTLTLGMR